MEVGNQIKALRAQRGITQETLATALGVSPQAVSKWENQAAAPDIQLLPAISTYFGVTIDQLFALSDETRMKRIKNMLYDERDVEPAIMEREMAFLRDKSKREPENSEVCTMLAWMENHIAQTHHRRAEHYAKEALLRNPEGADSHSELMEAVRIRCPDWYSADHHEIIDWYQDFLEKHPTDRRGCLWLMDALLEDGRLEEARAYCEKFAQLDHSYRTPHYQGIIAWKAGDWNHALSIWEQMCRDFPDNWMTWASMGDVMAESGRYAEAVNYYEKCKQFQSKPRYTDPWEAIALLKERMGDIPGAIACWEEELVILQEDWNTTDGESTDYVRREIDRLKRKLK